MSNPQMPNIPGAAVMTDTLDFVKNLWGSMSVPGLTAPTLSVDELDKKINDLKAVETWLNLNMSMLRGSIQALEVQRGTIATLKSVGASMAAAVNQGGGDAKSLLDTVPYASVFFQQAQAAMPAKAPVKETPPAPAAAPTPAAPAASAASANTAASNGSSAKPAASPNADAAAQMANPAVWWNLLQDQFKQAVSSTLGPEAMTSAGKMAAAATAAATSVAKSAANAATAATAAAKPKMASAAEAAKSTPAKPATKAAAKPRAVKAKPASKSSTPE
ncbi:MAG TPA: PhaM family polyhydroxyalkanoate granule multifunctional regulatory protein [Burkholderiaceae bacterium]|nr:PhaM family polyhydroxyalkanoate granule multifunctional regulatory protein [Burkholderiaceae bacterium]